MPPESSSPPRLRWWAPDWTGWVLAPAAGRPSSSARTPGFGLLPYGTVGLAYGLLVWLTRDQGGPLGALALAVGGLVLLALVRQAVVSRENSRLLEEAGEVATWARRVRQDGTLDSPRVVLLTGVGAALDRGSHPPPDALLAKPVRRDRLAEALQALSRPAGVNEAKPAEDSASRGAGLAGRVLLVEDNAVNVHVAHAMLTALGLEVEIADDGESALRALEASGFHLVLMDCMLPGIDGFEATRRWRESEAARHLPRLPVIALTANAIRGNRERCLAAGMDDYLSKPFRQYDLRAVLERWIGEEREPGGTEVGAGAGAAVAS